MNNDHSTERLDYQSGQRNEKEQRGEYTPRPKHQIVLAWVLLAIVVFGSRRHVLLGNVRQVLTGGGHADSGH